MSVAEALKRAGLSVPRTLTISLTTECNLRCEHCWVECDGIDKGGVSAPADKVIELIESFAAMGGEEVCLTGGEPLLYPAFLDVLSFCLGSDLSSVRVQTNATLISQGLLETLAVMPTDRLAFQVSLDGSSPATYDQVRGIGSFERAVAGLSCLLEAGYGSRITLGFTEMQHNFHEIPELLAFAADKGIASVVGWSMVQHGHALTAEDIVPPRPEQYAELLTLYHDDRQFRAHYDKHGCFAAIEWFKGREYPTGHCCCFIEKPYVSAAGTLYPCVLLQNAAYAAMNIYDQPFVESIEAKIDDWVLLQSRAVRRSQELNCIRGCVGGTHCAGGCFARATSTESASPGPEDRCALRRAVYWWRPPQ